MTKRPSSMLAAVILAAAFTASAHAQPANFKDWAANHNPGGTEATGDPIAVGNPVGWQDGNIGLAYDYFDGSSVWFFHEPNTGSGIWTVDQSPHGANPTPFIYSKLGGQSTDGGSIRPSDGYVFAADFNGDLAAIDDNIYLFDRSGNTVAFWETHGGLNGTPCSGAPIDVIIDVAVDHNDETTLYAVNAADNNIYAVDVSDTSGGAVANSSCSSSVVATAPAPIAVAIAIEYDACQGGYWIADFASGNVVLVDDDGTFNTVRASFSAHGGAGFNSGISPAPGELWTTDFATASYSIFENNCSPGTGNFAVQKDFTDNNEAEVEVTLSCNTGLPLEQTTTISEGDGVNFVVVDFEPGTLDCEVTEVVPAGYTVSYNGGAGCEFEDVVGGANFCLITNTLDPVDVEVSKVWIDENPQFNAQNVAEGEWSCSNVSGGGSDSGLLDFFGNPGVDTFPVFPDWDTGTTCSVVEVSLFDGGVEVDDSECQGLVVFPGEGASCTIFNTRLYEGIPTLSQYGLAVLALLMLGVGFVAFRRIA